VILGTQFGDEAKGKITDFLASDAQYVVRTGGGPNAGHTIHLPEGVVVLHQLACGVLRHGVVGVSGPGMVLQLERLEEELQELSDRHLLKGEVMLSERAHVILPIHEIEDAWEDDLRGRESPGHQLGTTRRGIGPAYADRYARFGIRMADLIRPALLAERLDVLYSTKSHLTGLPTKTALCETLTGIGSRLSPYIRATEPILWEALARGETILLEGAQSALLDIDFGTYPFVTSHHPTSAGALLGSGLPPQEVGDVIGVTKAYATRVGVGPFPTEVSGEVAAYLQREGGERGATTGRMRRCGWLDLVLLRYATRLNGFTSLALTKVDVLGGLEQIPVCVEYRTPAGETLKDYPPAVADELEKVTPVYRNQEAWPPFTSRLKEKIRREGHHALPAQLRSFAAFLEREVSVPVAYISYGSAREETLSVGRVGPARPASRIHKWGG